MVVLESMKMQHDVGVDFACEVLSVHVEVGATVREGDLLAVVKSVAVDAADVEPTDVSENDR
ncbi:MAG: biotin/lipoyl-containing protein, partial [Actinomycetota bacterium]